MAGPWEAYQQTPTASGPWEDYAGQADVDRAKSARSILGAALPMFGGEYIPDAAMGMKKAWDAAAQALARVSGAGPGNSAEVANQATLDAYNKYFRPSETVGDVPAKLAQGVGQGLLTGPLMPAIKGAGLIKSAITGGASGGLGAAFEPIYDAGSNADYWTKLSDNMKSGAAFGGAIGGLGNVAGRIMSPNVQPAAQNLQDANIRLTPGEKAGGMLQGLEDRLSGFSIIGDVIRNAKTRGITDFNRAIYAKALEPFGEEGTQVAAKAKIGREGIAAVGDFLSAKYQSVLPQIKVAVDREFVDAMGDLGKMASALPETQQKQLVSIVRNELAERGLTPGQVISGETMKLADSKLGGFAAMYKGSGDPDQRLLGNAIQQVQSNLRQMVARQNPDTAPIVRAADEGWRTIKQIQDAGAALGSRDGIFTPATFLRAVKRSDKSPGDVAFSKGEAWNQKLAESAKDVLPNSVPDSGTAGRAALAAGLWTAATGGLGSINPALAIPGIALGSLYSLGMTKGGQVAGDAVKNLAPYLGLPLSSLVVGR